MSTEKTRKAFVISKFTDASTQRNFSAGEIVEITEGEFINFAAVDLVREPDAKDKGEVKTAP